MRRFIRSSTPGATYFFTVTSKDRRSSTLVDRVDILRGCFARVRALHPFDIDAVVVLPEHLHAMWTLPIDDAAFPLRWMLIKRMFTRAIGSSPWQERYWEHQIRDDLDYERHVNYIHFNPVKHGHVARAADWPYSSFHRYARQAVLPADWGLSVEQPGQFGE